MGKGLARPEFDVVIDSIVASIDYLSRNVRYSAPDNLALITGYGDSMQPTFSDGDILLVDTGITEIKIDAVYVMALKDELYIKRMQRRADGTFLMISDNNAYPPIEVSSAELKDSRCSLGSCWPGMRRDCDGHLMFKERNDGRLAR